MDKYFDINVTYSCLDGAPIQTISIGVYDLGRGRRQITKWILESNFREQEIEDILLVVKTVLLARLDVQLGMDLGLIS